MNGPWDCIVVGGGAAGLSAALVLGRARRTTLVIDAGGQSNLPAHAIGGLLAQEGTAPAELYAAAHAQLAGYPSVELRAGTVAGVEALAGGAGGDAARFAVTLEGGGRELARRLVLATGMDYVPPPLPGLAQLWGGAAFHCPFCHGWEVRERPLAVIANSEHAPRAGLLLRNWSDDVVLLTDGPARFDADGAARLRAAGVTIDERPLARLRADGEELRAIVFADGSELARAGAMVECEQRPRTALAASLGIALNERGAIVVDEQQATSLDGVFAAGDTSGLPQVSAAIGDGAAAGAFVVQSLVLAG